jgi:nucleoside-triphosphatase THEP1
VGGIAAPAVFNEEGQRVGYDLIDLRRGSRRSLARVVADSDVTPTVGPYLLDPEAVAQGNAGIISAIRDHLDLIAIDEIGPLEFRGLGWAAPLRVALLECGAGQELIVVVRPSLVGELATRFPSPLWASAEHVSPPWPIGG